METDQFLLALAERELAQFDNISLNVHNRILQVVGAVDSATFKSLKQQLANLSTVGFAKFDTGGLRDVEQERLLIISAIEKTTIYFSQKNEFSPAQLKTLDSLFQQIQEVIAMTSLLHQSVRLIIIGNTDGIGTKLYNEKLAQQRAEAVLNWLHSRGIEKSKLIIIQPKIIRFGETKPNPNFRNVTFKVKIERD